MRLSPIARSLFNLYTSTLLSGFVWAMILPTLPVLVTYFGVSVGAAAQTVTAFALGKFVGMPISGIVVDRLGTRAAMVGGAAACCIAALFAAGTPWFGGILASVAVIGTGDSVWTLGREVAGIDLARRDQRGRVMSGFHGIHNIGMLIGPLLGGVLTEGISFRAVFLACAAFAAVAVPLGLTAHGEASPSTQNPAGGVKGGGLQAARNGLRGLADLFHQIAPDLRTTYLVIVFATLTSIMFRSTFQAMFPLYAGSHLGFAPTEVGLLFTISGVFVFLMILPAGFVMDKVGRKWATVPSTGIPALAFVLMPFAGTFLQLAVLMALIGVAHGLSLGSLATSTYDVVPWSARGRLQALRRTVAEIGGVSGPLFGGILANAFDPGVPFLAYAPLLVLSSTLLAVVGRETLVR